MSRIFVMDSYLFVCDALAVIQSDRELLTGVCVALVGVWLVQSALHAVRATQLGCSVERDSACGEKNASRTPSSHERQPEYYVPD